ncbi:MAG: hypothetical protein J3Q66DRAFT_202858 [Benniella sp.]|nr:MAG: hypothetical protein J3Q66DRAFT_202858 [Benniella sp.]
MDLGTVMLVRRLVAYLLTVVVLVYIRLHPARYCLLLSVCLLPSDVRAFTYFLLYRNVHVRSTPPFLCRALEPLLGCDLIGLGVQLPALLLSSHPPSLHPSTPPFLFSFLSLVTIFLPPPIPTAGCLTSHARIPTLDIMTATIFTKSLPSPAHSINDDPEGELSECVRDQLKIELEQIRKSTAESQEAYNLAYAAIPKLQHLVLSTHAKVAEAKKAVLEAKGISSSANSSTSGSAPTSNASSPPSSSSLLSLTHEAENEERLQKLVQEHIELGLTLSQALRDKAKAEDNKKRLHDDLMRNKQRIKELEQKLREWDEAKKQQ